MPEIPDFEKVIIPAKPGHRIVIDASGASFYENVATGEQIPTGVHLTAGVGMTLRPFPVRTDATLCAPGELWVEGPDGRAERVFPEPTKEPPDA
jgi:hypothetical protein